MIESTLDDERANAQPLKLHLRLVTISRYTYRVVTLRPATSARFSTNYFHDTWHILTDREGAFVLARLLWGLAFQRELGTVVLLDGTHLVPTPFEADPPSPILLVPSALTGVDATLLRLLKTRLRHPASQKTIRWQTFGLPSALVEDESSMRRPEMRSEYSKEKMQRLGNFICYSAPPDVLRSRALAIYRMRKCKDTTYHYLADENRRGWHHPDGEVQVFRDFRDMVSSASVARRMLSRETSTIADDDERYAVQREAERVGQRLRAARRSTLTRS